MTMLADMADRIQSAFAPLATEMQYRGQPQTWQCKAAALAPAGATSLVLTPPAGLAALAAGDTFTPGGPAVKTIAAPAAVVSGSVTVAFSPALAAPIPAGAAVPVTRSTVHTVRGWIESLDITRPAGSLVQADDVIVNILVDSLPITPAPDHQLVAGGRVLTVRHAARDGFGGLWRILAKG